MRARSIVLVVVVATAVLAAAASPGSAVSSSTYCRPIQNYRAEVIRVQRRDGCGTTRRIALLTVESRYGYFSDRRWHCRWGEGGTRPVYVHGHRYYGGFCQYKPTYTSASFLGRRLR